MPSPLRTATIQSCVLASLSSIIAQLISSYRSDTLYTVSSPLNPLGLDYTVILRFLLFTLLNTPPNFLWQQFLEQKFPAYPNKKGKQKVKVDDGGKGVTVEKSLDLKNTAIKFILDQTIGSALNTVGFLAGMKAMNGGGFQDCVEIVKEEYWNIQIAAWKLWPLVSILNFTVIPVERRVFVGSLVGLGWGVFMALRATE